MSCSAILKKLYEPKMDVILTDSLQNNSGNRDNETYVLCPTLQKRTCIGVLKSIIMFFHSFIAMDFIFSLLIARLIRLAIILPAEVSWKSNKLRLFLKIT